MKQFQNKETTITISDTVGVDTPTRMATYADLAKIVMNQVNPQQGVTTSIMRKNFRVIDVLEKAIEDKAETFEMEDSDATYFAEKVSTMNYGFQHKDLLTFEDDILKASKEQKSE